MRLAELRPGRWPWVTSAIVLAGAAVAAIPGADEFLQYDRSGVESGAYWKILGGQLAHWTPRMAAVDLLVLLVAGAWLESRSRRLVSWIFAAAALLVGITVHGWESELSLYRGSSGIASGLFVAVALELVRSRARGWVRGVALASLLLFGAKIAWETATGGTLAAGPLPSGVSVVPSVHLAGALAGVLCVLLVPTGESGEVSPPPL